MSLLFSCSDNLNESNTLNLSGEWEFINKDIINPASKEYNDPLWRVVIVPKRLEKQGIEPFTGVGWYERNVKIPKSFSGSLIGIYFSNIADADEVYFNSVLIGKSGSLEKNGSITPHYSKTYQIPSKLINYDKRNKISVKFYKQYGPFIGIFNQDPLIGSFSSLSKRTFYENIFKSYMIFFGSLFILLLGLYHLILYFYLKNRKDYLLFSLTCFFLFFFETTLSFLPYAYIENLLLVSKVNIIAAILTVSFLFWFILKYFDEQNRTYTYLNLSIPAIFATPILFINNANLNLRIFSIYFLFLGLYVCAMFYISIKNVTLDQKKGNLFIPIGLVIVLLTSLNDMFVTIGFYYFNLLTAYGFLVFVVGISISLANDFSNAYKAEELKAKTLQNINETSITLSSELNIDKLIDNSIRILKNQIHVDRCTIVLADDKGEISENGSHMFGDELREPISEIDFVMSDGQMKPYILKDVEDTFSGAREQMGRSQRELMIVPMLHGRKATGLIALSKKKGNQKFSDDDKEFVSIVAPQLALAVENATAYSQIEEQVKKQRNLLIMSEKMAAIGQLTSGIGHEINNPINFIISYVPPLRENVETLVEILELYDKLHSDGGPEDKNEREEILKKIENIKLKEKLEKKLPRILRSLDSISDGANRVANIVDSLKAYARMDTLPTEIDINTAIDKSLVILNNKLKNKVEIHKEYDGEVKSNCFSSINQVIVNLVANAADAIEEKGNIWIKTQAMKERIRFSVKDDGKGMDEEVKKKIFDPFFTTKGPTKGTGLGLSITYNIVYDQHGGTIDVQSEPGKGTLFTVTIPKNIATPNG